MLTLWWRSPAQLASDAPVSSAYSSMATKAGRPRWLLHLQARFWRVLMQVGMVLHRLAPPRPPQPDFTIMIPSKLSARQGSFALHFYVPRDYDIRRHLHGGGGAGGSSSEAPHGQRRSGTSFSTADDGGDGTVANTAANTAVNIGLPAASINPVRRFSRRFGRPKRYPVVVNFHGGGFTLGSAHDDARWIGTVVEHVGAIVVSVDYRLAPEHPFPTAVEDGADAVLYLAAHAADFGIDPDRIALSGFSSGANMCFTVPLRLQRVFPGTQQPASSSPSPSMPADGDPMLNERVEDDPTQPAVVAAKTPSPETDRSGDGVQLAPLPARINTVEPRICGLVSFYPPTDYTQTREQRRATCARADQQLSAIFTDLFDDSYLHPPSLATADPLLSPGVAPAAMLARLPDNVVIFACEWDMLRAEAERFRDRLLAPEAGPKQVTYYLVPGAPHGWDKAPNPIKPTPGVREHYLRACKQLRAMFDKPP